MNCPERSPSCPAPRAILDKELYVSALLLWVFLSVPLDAEESHSRDGGRGREMGNTTALAQISDLMLALLADLAAKAEERQIRGTEASWLLATDGLLELTVWPADRHK